MTWALIFWFGVTSGYSSPQVLLGFQSEKDCLYAGAQIESTRRLQTNHSGTTTFVCVPMGKGI